MSIIDKFNKRIITVFDKNTGTAAMWAKAMFERLDLADWKLFKVIILNKDRKFYFRN